MDENRRIINQHRTLVGKSKVSYTHLIGWAIVRALEDIPGTQPRLRRAGRPALPRGASRRVNLGIAVDVAGKDGARSLMVPEHQERRRTRFRTNTSTRFRRPGGARPQGQAHARPISRAPRSRSPIPAPSGTMSSNPRLMPGQGAIIAAGAIDYPAEYRGAADETRAMLGISKVMTLTCTYDHRIIQGAESGLFLGKMQALLDGNDGFYEEIFEHLRMPHQPVRWETDRKPLLPGMTAARHAEIAKEAGDHPDDQRLPRARPPDRRSRSARRASRATIPSSIPRPTASPSGTWIANFSPAAWGRRSAKAARSRSPRCARFWRRCARPTAAKSAAST